MRVSPDSHRQAPVPAHLRGTGQGAVQGDRKTGVSAVVFGGEGGDGLIKSKGVTSVAPLLLSRFGYDCCVVADN
jgi:hypothetical protein